MADRNLVIAMDGPSGSGKSSTARGVAQRLGLDYLDTGAMYRAVTTEYLRLRLLPEQRSEVAVLCREAELEIGLDPANPSVVINGRDVTRAIREPEIAANVSTVASNLDVRADLVARQRAIIEGSTRGIVVEGRDITSVVAPDADLRLLIQADPEARVGRRSAEVGGSADDKAVRDSVLKRDRDDAKVSEFEEPGPGVSVIDTTSLTLAEVVDRIVALATAAGA